MKFSTPSPAMRIFMDEPFDDGPSWSGPFEELPPVNDAVPAPLQPLPETAKSAADDKPAALAAHLALG